MIAPALFAVPAHADDRATCKFTGRLGLTSPGAPSLLTEVNESGNFTTVLDTDSGGHALLTSATCVKVDTDPGEDANTGRYDVNIWLEGPYTSRVCGTWMSFFDPVLDDVSALSSHSAGWQGPIPITYGILLKAGTATLDFTGGTWDGKPLTGSGTMTMTPEDGDGNPSTEPCVDEDLIVLAVNGVFDIEAIAPPSL
jgi:hypothetical protein